MPYSFEAVWRPYAYPREENRLSLPQEVMEKLTRVDLDTGTIPAAGMPMYSDGHTAWVNPDCDHGIVMGPTGSKKSRSLVAPTACMCMAAGQSLVLVDVKGEFSTGTLAPFVRGTAQKFGYEERFFDLRSFHGDGFNVLSYPCRLYKSGYRDTATELVGDLIAALAAIYKKSRADPFWDLMASLLLSGIIIILFTICDDERKINLLSVMSCLNERGWFVLQKWSKEVSADNLIFNQLQPVLDAADKTRQSIFASAASFIQRFMLNTSLVKMLCSSSFDLDDIWRKKTILYLIVPDETSEYDSLVSVMIGQLCSALNQAAYKLGGSLPRRVNFLVDEAANFYIPNLDRCCSALRSRNVRFMLFGQGIEQFKNAYPKEAPTILCNCRDAFSLGCQEQALYDFMVERIGSTTATANGAPKPLISQEQLRSLKVTREYGEALCTSSKGIKYVTRLPDISCYPAFSNPKADCTIPCRTLTSLDNVTYTPEHMLMALKTKGARIFGASA